MKEIPLTHGKVALVDDEDFEWLSKFKWSALHVGRLWYAVRSIQQNYKQTYIYMHRFIANNISNEVDHDDGNGLNNQRYNLREATHLQNQRNRKQINKNNTSGFKGVVFNKGCKNKWTAQISLNYKTLHIGQFPTPEDAAHAYDLAAIEYFGEFAATNFSRENYTR